VHTDAEEPLTHRFKSGHLLDVVRVEVLELQPVREQHPTDEPDGGHGEAALVEDHERYHIPTGRAWHRLVGGYDPSKASVRGGSWPASTRRRSCSRETLECVQFDIATAKSWGELEVQAATTLWMRKNSELKGLAQERRSE
jgi:hypothetical protein